MEYFRFKKPFVPFSKDTSGRRNGHPHIVMGMTEDRKYVSVGISHSNKVDERDTKRLPCNPRSVWYISDRPFVMDKSEYIPPRNSSVYRVPSVDVDLLDEFIRSTPENLHW